MTRRKEKLLRMLDCRMQQLIIEEEYELCAKIRDWREEIVNSASREVKKDGRYKDKLKIQYK